MSYQISYSPDFWKDRPQKKREKKNGQILHKLGIFLFVAAFASCIVWGDQIKSFFIPGDVTVTTAAADHLCENLKDGQQLTEALMEFYLEIWDHEQVY